MSQLNNDPEFIARLQSGDNSAFKSLISSYHSKLLIVARAIAGDVFAEDVTQEAWASIYKACLLYTSDAADE